MKEQNEDKKEYNKEIDDMVTAEKQQNNYGSLDNC